jgi:hypothetical protein
MSLLACAIKHDGVVKNPLGAGAYILRKDLIPHLLQYCHKNTLILQIGAQPNNSPHIGTIITFAVAFAIAHRINLQQDRDVLVSLDIVDTAPSQQVVINGINYQKSQRYTGEMETYMRDYQVILASLHKNWGVRYRIRRQAEFLDDPKVVVAVRKILDQREELQRSFSPETGCLGIRSTCPVADCGLADKYGVRNVYEGAIITFYCPHHGEHKIDITDTKKINRLEFNTPLRNLLRAKVFANDEQSDWIRVTGQDYAGYYQEQLLWRHMSDSESSPIIFYAPLILDWSGAKVSKSLYVDEGGYDYLISQGLEYCLSFEKFQAERKDLAIVFKEVDSWVDEPYKLFRSYSLEHIHTLFERAGRCDGMVA